VGRHIKAGKAEAEGEWMTVVGVVNDVRYSGSSRTMSPDLPLVPAGPSYYTTLCYARQVIH